MLKRFHMKKNLFITACLALISISAMATKESVFLKFHRKGSNDKATQVDRAPMRLPIDVYIDSEAGVIEVAGDDALEADVTLCDETGAALDYSPVLNASFTVEGLNPAYVLIEGENWYATADLDLNFN